MGYRCKHDQCLSAVRYAIHPLIINRVQHDTYVVAMIKDAFDYLPRVSNADRQTNSGKHGAVAFHHGQYVVGAYCRHFQMPLVLTSCTQEQQRSLLFSVINTIAHFMQGSTKSCEFYTTSTAYKKLDAKTFF